MTRVIQRDIDMGYATIASSATPSINTDIVSFFEITAQTVAITSMTTNLSGTPTLGQLLWIAITGTANSYLFISL